MTPIVIYLFIFLFSCSFARIICCLVVWFYSACIHVWLSVSVCFYDCPSFLQSVYLLNFLFTFCNIHLNILYLFILFISCFPYMFSHIRSLDNLVLLFVCLFLEWLIHTFQCEKPRNPSRSCKPFGFHGRLHHVQWASQKGKLYFALLFYSRWTTTLVTLQQNKLLSARQILCRAWSTACVPSC